MTSGQSGLSAKMKEAGRLLEPWKRPLLLTHEKPDGDALGSLAALRTILRSRGVAATAMLFDEIPPRYSIFHKYPPMDRLEAGTGQLNEFDGIVILDTCSLSQLGPVADRLRVKGAPRIVIDHHATRDDLGACEVIDPSASATCLLLHEWCRLLRWRVEAEAAEAMFIGIAMDTGWFRHSNTDARTAVAAAALAESGVSPNALYESLYQCESVGRVRLLGKALESMEIRMGGRLAVMTLTTDAFRAAGAGLADTEDIVNEPLRIADVWVSILFVEQGDGVVRINARSKAPRRGASVANIDVASITRSLGGGGHRRAAGARVPGGLSEVKPKVLVVVERAIAET